MPAASACSQYILLLVSRGTLWSRPVSTYVHTAKMSLASLPWIKLTWSVRVVRAPYSNTRGRRALQYVGVPKEHRS